MYSRKMQFPIIQFLSITLILILLSPLFCSAGNESVHGFDPRVHAGGVGRSRRAISTYTFSKDDIPGTNLKSGTFYVLRMKRFPSGYVSWSTRKHDSGYNYVFVDNVEAHRTKYGTGGEWHKDVQWAFLSSSEPGWYHLINRGVPCQYSTWSDSETIDSEGTFHMTVDPNYPGTHAEDDFLFKPYQPFSEIADSGYYQLKLKSLPNAVIAWNAGNSSNQAYYIHVESTDDENWLKRYSWGHIWYDDTLFSFEEVRDQDEQRLVEDEEEVHAILQQRQYASLVGEPGYGYNAASGVVICGKYLTSFLLTIYLVG